MMRSLPSLPLERMSAVFSCGVARCLKNMGKLHPEMQRRAGWLVSEDTAMMLKPKERERSEALTTTKHKQPGAGKQFTSRSLRGVRRTTHSELFGSTWALPRSNGSPAACRSDVIFLSDIFLNKVANDHTRENPRRLSRQTRLPWPGSARRGSLPAAGIPRLASGRRRQRPCPPPGGLRERGPRRPRCCRPAPLLRHSQAGTSKADVPHGGQAA